MAMETSLPTGDAEFCKTVSMGQQQHMAAGVLGGEEYCADGLGQLKVPGSC